MWFAIFLVLIALVTPYKAAAESHYATITQGQKADKALPATNPVVTGGITTPTVIPSSPDGTWRMNVRNSVSRTYTPQEGDMDTDAAGRIWLYVSGAWVEKGAPYTLPTAGPNQLGGVKTGNTLTIANGVLDVMVSSLGPSGLVTAGLGNGDQTISSGFAYIATSTPWKATFNSYTSTKQTTVFASYSGTVCAASGSKLYWPNPVTFANNSGSCAKLRTGTRATVQMQGGRTYATATQNLQKASIPMASVSPTTLAFGNVVAGSTSSPLTATLTNSGLTNLVTGTPTISGTDALRFSISTNGCNAATVTAGSTCTESVTFNPTAAGNYSAQLNLPHNATGSPTVVALAGTGISSAYLISEEFETGGTPTNWTSTGTNPYGYTPALAGSYSMRPLNASSAVTPAFTAASDIYVAYALKVSAFAAGFAGITEFKDASNASLGLVTLNSTGTIYAAGTSGTSISANTLTYMKVRYQKGTGANAVVTVWSSPTGASGTWTQKAIKSNATATTDAVKIAFSSTGVAGASDYVFDSVRVSASDINY